MNFCILRTKKLSTFGGIAGSGKHTFREIDTPNADVSKTHSNRTWGAQTSAALCKSVRNLLPEKRRKDSVLCIEYLITASPEWFEEATTAIQNEYFRLARQWLEQRHGKTNIICLNMQLDEKSPHMVAYVVPLTADGRLAAKEFLGGRDKLRKMQSEFARMAGKPVGLERGVEGSKAKHKTVKAFYAELNKDPTLKPPKPLAPSLFDRVTGKAKEAEEAHEEEMQRYVNQVEQARNVALVGKQARDQQARAIAKMRKRLDELEGEHEKAEELRNENKTLRTRVRELETKLEEVIHWLMMLILALLGVNVDLRKQAEAAHDEAAELRARMRRPVSQLIRLGKNGKD